MSLGKFRNLNFWPAGFTLAIALLAASLAYAGERDRSVYVLTSTNSATGNGVVVFKLEPEVAPSLGFVHTLPTGGNGGASTNAGILQVQGNLGAVANFGSNTVTQIVRYGDLLTLGQTINLPSGCVKPDSVALGEGHLYVVGATCAESHHWPGGGFDGKVSLTDSSAAQIAVGQTWSAVTLTSGSLLQLPLKENGGLSGASNALTLPANANSVPLGEAFWQNVLGFTPAHSPDSFAIVDPDGTISPVVGPTPPFPTNAPCWVAKGAGNIWYTGNSPAGAISIFFSDSKGGVFYKSVPLPGAPTDITVSHDGQWLAVIYSTGGQAYVAVFSIDSYGDLTPLATSSPIGVPSFNGVAFSE